MRIIEIIQEQQTIGSVGSTTGMTQPVGTPPTVSQNPSADAKQEKPSPELTKLAATLRNSGVIKTEPEINDFISAYSAKQKNPTSPLNDKQQELMANLAAAQMKNKNLDQNLDLQIKTMSQQKPGQTSTTPTIGQTPAPKV
jgi:hypothetical protein